MFSFRICKPMISLSPVLSRSSLNNKIPICRHSKETIQYSQMEFPVYPKGYLHTRLHPKQKTHHCQLNIGTDVLGSEPHQPSILSRKKIIRYNAQLQRNFLSNTVLITNKSQKFNALHPEKHCKPIFNDYIFCSSV